MLNNIKLIPLIISSNILYKNDFGSTMLSVWYQSDFDL